MNGIHTQRHNDQQELQTRQTIVRLLSTMGGAKEISQYLKRFSQLDAKRFAVVKVGGAVIRDELEALTSSLSFLQDVGLTPIVVHGAGPQLDAALQEAGIQKETVDGLRVTPPEVLKVVRRVLQTQNLRLVEALQAADTRATSIVSGVFESVLMDADRLGMVGDVCSIETAPIEAALHAGSIPVIASLGETGTGQIVNINADVAANELVKRLQPYKVVFLTGTGGLLDTDGDIIDSINLTTEYDDLMQADWINGGMRLKIRQIHDLLMELPLSTSVSITKPSELAKELFTHTGSGTLVRRGERVLSFDRWEDLDLPRMRELIESAFERRLASDYFETTPLVRAYISESYRAAIILTQGVDGITYLDKFAVTDDAQGEGLGRAVWNVMDEQFPQVYWRSRASNPINAFYNSVSDGSMVQGIWRVFWCGLDQFSQIEACVRDAAERRPNLEDAKPVEGAA